MPTYVFECEDCKAEHGIVCPISQYDQVVKPGVQCEECNKPMKRVIEAAAVHMPANFTYNGKKKNL